MRFQFLTDPKIIAELRLAWQNSEAADATRRHEEGGYIVELPTGAYAVERWPRGEAFRIKPAPLGDDNRYNGRKVIATFHTHPNPPVDEKCVQWEQGPGASDRLWHAVRQLQGLVISDGAVYEIASDGGVSELGRREDVLK